MAFLFGLELGRHDPAWRRQDVATASGSDPRCRRRLSHAWPGDLPSPAKEGANPSASRTRARNLPLVAALFRCRSSAGAVCALAGTAIREFPDVGFSICADA
jgi:hypothetical protein